MGRNASARLLLEAATLLAGQGSPAVQMGWLRLHAELQCPTGPEPAVDARDRAALAELELETAGAAA